MTCSIAYPFFGTYQNNELGFSLSFISIIGILHVIVRCIASVFLGKYADKTSFGKMLNVAYIFGVIGYVVMIFTVPANGKWAFPLFYSVFFAIFQAGYGNGKMNLVYDTVEKSQRTGAFALYNTLGGLAGFATTLLCSTVVSKIQENGNSIFGIQIYAQQFLSIITVLLMLVTLLCLNLFLLRKKK
jgi:MFS family permease